MKHITKEIVPFRLQDAMLSEWRILRIYEKRSSLIKGGDL